MRHQTGKFVLSGFILISFLSPGAVQASRVVKKSNSFTAGVKDQLQDLAREISQLKNREKNIPAERKAAFKQDVDGISSHWQSLNDTVSSITKNLTGKQKKELSNRVAGLEHELDKAEDDYSDKQLGLGELLGF